MKRIVSHSHNRKPRNHNPNPATKEVAVSAPSGGGTTPSAAVLIELKDFAKRNGFEALLTPQERRRSTRVPANPSLVEAAASAVETFGSALGSDFDAAQLRADLAAATGLAPIASAARTLTRAITDAMVVRQAAIANTVEAILAALKAKGMTANGQAMAAAALELAALRKRRSRPKQPKPTAQPAAPKAPAAPVPTTGGS